VLGISSDIWSFGVVFYQILTGRTFMECSTIQEGKEFLKFFLDNKITYVN